MSIETLLKAQTDAIAANTLAIATLTQALMNGTANVAAPAAAAPVVAANVNQVPNPPVDATPMVAGVAAAGMPAAPAFMPSAPTFVSPAAVAPTVPFTDLTSLTAYVTAAYHAMGAAKGNRIGEILTALGVVNINDITPPMYAKFHEYMEALKAAPVA